MIFEKHKERVEWESLIFLSSSQSFSYNSLSSGIFLLSSPLLGWRGSSKVHRSRRDWYTCKRMGIKGLIPNFFFFRANLADKQSRPAKVQLKPATNQLRARPTWPNAIHLANNALVRAQITCKLGQTPYLATDPYWLCQEPLSLGQNVYALGQKAYGIGQKAYGLCQKVYG